MTIDLSGSALDQAMVQDCIPIVQSHVLGPNFNPQLFFSGSLLLAVQNAIAPREKDPSVVHELKKGANS